MFVKLHQLQDLLMFTISQLSKIILAIPGFDTLSDLFSGVLVIIIFGL